MSLRTTLYLLAAVLLTVGACLLLRNCQPKPVAPPATYLSEIDTKARENALADSLYAIHRQRLDSAMHAHEVELAQVKAAYPEVVYRDRKATDAYRAAPSLALCDTALAAKDGRILSLERQDSLSGLLITAQGATISFQDSTLLRKNEHIQALDDLARRMLADYTNASKPKRFAVVVGPGLHVGRSAGPSLNLTIGYKLTQF